VVARDSWALIQLAALRGRAPRKVAVAGAVGGDQHHQNVPGPSPHQLDATGVQPVVPNARLGASLPIPSGSTIYQFNGAYQRQPLMEVWK
jgi:hypothetical protein